MKANELASQLHMKLPEILKLLQRDHVDISYRENTFVVQRVEKDVRKTVSIMRKFLVIEGDDND